MTVKRYEWEDALIDAQVKGQIPNGALLVALKLAKAITWEPKDGKPSGLYWKNEDALKDVGCGRATYFKHRTALFDSGFLVEVKGNLIPVVPQSIVQTAESIVRTAAQSTVETEKSTVETKQSIVETEKSTVETKQSIVETEKSTGHNPYTVDTYTVDVSSGDKCTVDAASHGSEAGGTSKKVIQPPFDSKSSFLPSSGSSKVAGVQSDPLDSHRLPADFKNSSVEKTTKRALEHAANNPERRLNKVYKELEDAPQAARWLRQRVTSEGFAHLNNFLHLAYSMAERERAA